MFITKKVEEKKNPGNLENSLCTLLGVRLKRYRINNRGGQGGRGVERGVEGAEREGVNSNGRTRQTPFYYKYHVSHFQKRPNEKKKSLLLGDF